MMGNTLWVIIKQSDAITIGTLLVLLGMSIICWSIFIYKLLLVRSKKRQLKIALDKIAYIKTVDDLTALITQHAETLPGYLLGQYLGLIKTTLKSEAEGKIAISEATWNHMQEAIGQSLEDIMHNENSYVTVLSTSAAAAPLLGLFGTVWGLIHAFVRISQAQSADIATVAPGIAEALITTLAGLVVAIPALVLYHYLINSIGHLEHSLYMFSEKLNWTLYRLLIQEKKDTHVYVTKEASSHPTYNA